MNSYFLATSVAGANRDLSVPTREQPYWDAHAAFIDQLVSDGFIAMGGPLTDVGGAMLVVRAGSEADVRARLAPDPWTTHGILQLVSVQRWDIFIDELHS